MGIRRRDSVLRRSLFRARLETLEDRRLLSAPRLTEDLATAPLGGAANVSQFYAADTFAMFENFSFVDGRRLWRTDGTPSGTYSLAVRDLWVDHDTVTKVDDLLYFVATDREHGRAIWKTDGTDAGTSIVISYDNGPRFGAMTNLQGTLYFAVQTDTHFELWRSGGAAAETERVAEFPTNQNERITEMAAVNSNVFIRVLSSNGEVSLWTSDGSTEGTRPVRGVGQANFGFDTSMIEIDGIAYFTAADADSGSELWRSDGTADGTYRALDIFPGPASSYPSGLTRFRSDLYFTADSGNGRDLCRINVAANRLEIVKDYGPNSVLGFELKVLGENIYFTAADGGHDTWLWRSDGTTEGTIPIKDPSSKTGLVIQPQLAIAGDYLYFIAADDDGVEGVWSSDGTPAGTAQLVDSEEPGQEGHPGGFVALGDHMLFVANDDIAGQEIWSSAGAPETTRMIIELGSGTIGTYPATLADVDGDLFFAARNQVWKRENSAGESELVAALGSRSTWIEAATSSGGRYYFTDGVAGGSKLWVADSSHVGARIVHGSGGDNLHQNVRILADVNGTLFYTAWNADFVDALWKSDGTEAGTVKVLDIKIDWRNGFAPDVVMVRGELYFSANDGVHGWELWKSDGTPDGTKMVKDIEVGEWHSSPNQLTAFHDKLYFTKGESGLARELWNSDGTEAETKRIDILTTNDDWPYIVELIPARDRLFVFGRGEFGTEYLWSSDRTPDSARLLRTVGDLRARKVNPYQQEFAVVDDLLYFTAGDETTGVELWSSDGTSEGTAMVADLFPGAGASNPHSLRAFDGRLYFVADDGVHGDELWTTDGSAAGTRMIADIAPGGLNSRVAQLTVVGEQLYFVANDRLFGDELWVLDADPVLPGDTDQDGDVDLVDLQNVRNHFGETGDVLGDVDRNGVVDLADLNWVRNQLATGAARNLIPANGSPKSAPDAESSRLAGDLPRLSRSTLKTDVLVGGVQATVTAVSEHFLGSKKGKRERSLIL